MRSRASARTPLVGARRRRTGRLLLCVLTAGWSPSIAHEISEPAAACPLDRAIYRDVEDTASLEFMPDGETATVTNGFRMLLGTNLVLDGIVMWTQDVRRPVGMLSYNCPEGDVTGEELAACTVWQGVVYTLDKENEIGLLPPPSADAPARLILPDLGPSLRHSSAYGADGFTDVPWDVFAFKSCRQ